MANILEAKITPKNIKAIWEQVEQDLPPFLGEAFFDNVKQIGIELNLIKGKRGTPVALVSANWDTDVLCRDRIGFESLTAEMPFFKEAYKVDELTRQKILTLQENYRDPLFKKVFDDIMDLILAAKVTAERLRMQILGTGTISIQENGVDKQYDYGFVSGNQLKTEGTLWSASGAKPLKSLMTRIKEYKNTFKKSPKYAVFGFDAYDALLGDAEILGHFSGLAVPVLNPTEEEIKSYVESRTGLKIYVADQSYIKARSNTSAYYYPTDRYTLFAEADLGDTVYGTTPEELDLLSEPNAKGEVVDEGVAITTWAINDPVNVITKVSEVVLPSCPKVDSLYIVKVL